MIVIKFPLILSIIVKNIYFNKQKDFPINQWVI